MTEFGRTPPGRLALAIVGAAATALSLPGCTLPIAPPPNEAEAVPLSGERTSLSPKEHRQLEQLLKSLERDRYNPNFLQAVSSFGPAAGDLMLKKLLDPSIDEGAALTFADAFAGSASPEAMQSFLEACGPGTSLHQKRWLVFDHIAGSAKPNALPVTRASFKHLLDEVLKDRPQTLSDPQSSCLYSTMATFEAVGTRADLDQLRKLTADDRIPLAMRLHVACALIGATPSGPPRTLVCAEDRDACAALLHTCLTQNSSMFADSKCLDSYSAVLARLATQIGVEYEPLVLHSVQATRSQTRSVYTEARFCEALAAAGTKACAEQLIGMAHDGWYLDSSAFNFLNDFGPDAVAPHYLAIAQDSRASDRTRQCAVFHLLRTALDPTVELTTELRAQIEHSARTVLGASAALDQATLQRLRQKLNLMDGGSDSPPLNAEAVAFYTRRASNEKNPGDRSWALEQISNARGLEQPFDATAHRRIMGIVNDGDELPQIRALALSVLQKSERGRDGPQSEAVRAASHIYASSGIEVLARQGILGCVANGDPYAVSEGLRMLGRLGERVLTGDDLKLYVEAVSALAISRNPEASEWLVAEQANPRPVLVGGIANILDGLFGDKQTRGALIDTLALAERANTGEGPTLKEALRACEHISIRHPFRFTPAAIREIVWNRIEPTRFASANVRIALFGAEGDHNGAFANAAWAFDQLMVQLPGETEPPRMVYLEDGGDVQLQENIRTAAGAIIHPDGTITFEHPFHLGMHIGHGSRDSISRIATDPRLASKRLDNSITTDRSDAPWLVSYSGALADGGTWIIDSCSVGTPSIGNGTPPLAVTLAEAAPQARAVWAAESPILGSSVRFKRIGPNEWEFTASARVTNFARRANP